MTESKSRGAAGGPGVLIVGFDGHPACRAALRYALGLAEPLGDRVVVVHVVDAEDEPVDPDAPEWEGRVDAAAKEVRDAAADVVRACASAVNAGAYEWEFRVRSGGPAAVLAAEAAEEGARMVVLGAPRTGLASAMERLLGDAVAVQLLRHGGLPVLVVPEDSRPAR